MTLFKGSNQRFKSTLEAARLAEASYVGETPPANWTTISPIKWGFATTGAKKEYYAGPNGADARIMQKLDKTTGKMTIAISFRGTDQKQDLFEDWKASASKNGDYWKNFDPLIKKIIAAYPKADFILTGHSLGASTVNQIADRYAELGFKSRPAMYGFSSPYMSENGNITNYGHINDPINGFYSPDNHSIQDKIRYLTSASKVKDIHGIVGQIDSLNKIYVNEREASVVFKVTDEHGASSLGTIKIFDPDLIA